MLRKKTIREKLTGLLNSKSYQVDENTVNLCINLLAFTEDDDRWRDVAKELPDPYETVLIKTKSGIKHTGYRIPEGDWVVANATRITGENMEGWKPIFYD